ncbi:hypothetical protein VNO80_22458 [Phaseolus coccineus]|uniref:Uncharacterized protein n=1 Tax=Phaseolus coccineus TaxID=3886 RepID=A0AAN9QRS3_PHACN
MNGLQNDHHLNFHSFTSSLSTPPLSILRSFCFLKGSDSIHGVSNNAIKHHGVVRLHQLCFWVYSVQFYSEKLVLRFYSVCGEDDPVVGWWG